MKKKIFNYYAVIMTMFYFMYNVGLRYFNISGLFYRIIVYLLIVVNAIILIIFRKDIKYKDLLCTLYCFIWVFSKNLPQLFFAVSNIIIFFFTSPFKSKILKGCGGIAISLLLYVIFMFSYDENINEDFSRSNIHSNKHYYCENNYEAYVLTASAIDSYHFCIGIYRDILNIDDLIQISYNKASDVSYEEYDNFLNTHKCKLIGEVDESK